MHSHVDTLATEYVTTGLAVAPTTDEGELDAALSACRPLIVRNPGFRAVLQCKRLLVDTVRAEEEREHCCPMFW